MRSARALPGPAPRAPAQTGAARREVGGKRAHRLLVYTETMWAYETLTPARGPSSANHSCVLHAFLGELPLQDASRSFHIAIDGFVRSAYLPLGAVTGRHACAHSQSGGGHDREL